MDQPLLELENLRVDFHTPTGIVHAVRGLSFTLGRERIGIVGVEEEARKLCPYVVEVEEDDDASTSLLNRRTL